MHRSFFATKDTFINSGSDFIDGTTFEDKNVGKDEILELKKYYFNRTLQGFTRALIQFNTDEIESYISSSVLTTTNDYKVILRMYEAAGTSGLSENYTIAANALTQSWDEGVGKEADDPKTTDGCSWLYRKNNANAKEIPWSPQYPEGESVDGAVATASIDFTNFQSSSLFFIKNSNPTFPEIDSFQFSFINDFAASNDDFSRFYNGNGNYFVSTSGSLDFQGGRLRDTINLFQLKHRCLR